MKTPQESFDEIADGVIKLVWSYTVFRALFEKQAVDPGSQNQADFCDTGPAEGEAPEPDRYFEARSNHPELFLTLHESLLCSFCNTTALLFTDKANAESLSNLIAEVETSKPGAANDLYDKIRQKNEAIRRIVQMRHQTFAHRYKSKTQKQVWDELGLQLRLMKEVADLAQEVILKLDEEMGGRHREPLAKQWLSETTLSVLSNDAGHVLTAFR